MKMKKKAKLKAKMIKSKRKVLIIKRWYCKDHFTSNFAVEIKEDKY